MEKLLYFIFISSALAPVYTYLIYPIILRVLPKKHFKESDSYYPTVTVLIAAYNEEKVIKEKIENLERIKYPKELIEFIIASDGSTDDTVRIAKKSIKNSNIRIIDLPRGGKVSALNRLLFEAKGEIIVFSDANTMYDSEAILNLVKHFIDERIGCVNGQLKYKITETSGEGAKSESFYWRYENWVKEQESKIGRLSGANGAIYAIKAGIIKKIEDGVINDDFYISTKVMEKGYAVIMDKSAIAYESPNDNLEDQFNRHVRDGAGHYQALKIFWKMLLPQKGTFVYISHRVVKWLVPFTNILFFIVNIFLINKSCFFFIVFTLQVIVYAVLLLYHIAIKKRVFKSNKVLGILYYFVSVNLALLKGFYYKITNKQECTWETKR